MNNLLDSLNEKQKIAAMQKEGPILILAGAGSGKTRTLTFRISNLIEHSIPPWNILAITFTNKAAKEMHQRVNSIIGDTGVWISTFHSLCVRILRMEIDKLGFDSGFAIYDADDSEHLIKDCIKSLNIDEKQFSPKNVMYTINSLKDKLITPQQFASDNDYDFRGRCLSDIYSLYQKRLKQYNALDFNDLIMKTVMLFQANTDVLEKYQDKFKYILVDEYQDTNMSQYILIKLLACKYKNLCVVGDDDQSVYGWRGADIGNILNFSKDFPNTLVIKLEQNYRSSKTILNAANAVVRNNFKRSDKTLWTKNPTGEEIDFYTAFDERDEANYVVNTIFDKVSAGAKYSDFAVLYRTNAQSRVIEDVLVSKSIPYRLLGGLRFYSRAEIKDLIAFLNTINNPNDDVSLKRIINIPKRGIGNTTIQKINNYALLNEKSFFSALNNYKDISDLNVRGNSLPSFIKMIDEFIELSNSLNVYELISHIIDSIDYIKYLNTEDMSVAESKIQNVNEFINKAYEYVKTAFNPTLASFLEEIALVADIDNYDQNEAAVVLMTLHSSKGLEFPHVFITGMDEGILPTSHSIYSDDISKLEEERRLCYVGMTRAEVMLYLVHSKTRAFRGEINYKECSRFIDEIPKEYLNIVKKNNNIRTSKNSFGFDVITKNTESILSENTPLKRQIEKPTLYHNKTQILKPSNVDINFKIGDRIKQQRYGIGSITDIKPAGADYEITISFDKSGVKKFMSSLVKLSLIKE